MPLTDYVTGSLRRPLLVLAVAGWRKGTLVPPPEILPELLQEPAQGATDRAPFSFDYKGKQCRVRPVASYELWGLVVSHNDIKSVADIYHDTSSVDTKDLCVLWGESLRHGDFIACESVIEAARAWDAVTVGVVDSGLPGPKGNREFFVHLEHRPGEPNPDDIDRWIADAVG